MKKLGLLLFFSFFLSGCTVKDLFLKKPAGLEIITTPNSTVYVNGQNEGSTPFKNENISPGNYTIKLIPEGNPDLPIWETNVKLNSQVSTIIHHNFASSNNVSSGYTLQLQPDPDKSKAFLSVVSDPDTANITIDGQPYGFTPLTKKETPPDTHTVEISSPGYISISLSVNTIKGYNLLINSKLAQDLIVLPEEEPLSATGSAQTTDELEDDSTLEASDSAGSDTISKPYVIIQETETGWLRVRQEPTIYSDELGKVDENEKLPFLDSNDSGWYQIIFEGQEGWISGSYATIVK